MIEEMTGIAKSLMEIIQIWFGPYLNVALAAVLLAVNVAIFARKWDRVFPASLFVILAAASLCALAAYLRGQLAFAADFGQGVAKVGILAFSALLLMFCLKFLVAPAVVHAWQFVFDHEVSPLRHIPSVSTRHLILQVLGWMWACAFSLAIGSYALVGYSVLIHTVLIAAAAVTVATYTTATVNPVLFPRILGRHSSGEHH